MTVATQKDTARASILTRLVVVGGQFACVLGTLVAGPIAALVHVHS